MSKKSIMFSVLAMVLFVAVLFGIVNIFKIGVLFGILSIFLLILPVTLQRKALDEANGGFDKIFAKYIVPTFAVVATIGFVMFINFVII